MLLIMSTVTSMAFSQKIAKTGDDSTTLTKSDIQKIGKTFLVDKCPDNPSLVGLHVTFHKGTMIADHDKAASKLSLKTYPKNGAHSSDLEKEIALGSLKFSKLHVKDLGDGEGYLFVHKPIPSTCKVYKQAGTETKKK